MYRALDIGMSVEEFWKSTPRCIITLLREKQKDMGGRTSGGRSHGGARVQKLQSLPRP